MRSKGLVRAGVALAALLALSALPSAAFAGGVYFVKEGDTLTRIGRVFGVGVDALRAANPLAGDRIAPGDRLRIPDPVAPAPALQLAAREAPEGGPRQGVAPSASARPFAARRPSTTRSPGATPSRRSPAGTGHRSTSCSNSTRCARAPGSRSGSASSSAGPAPHPRRPPGETLGKIASRHRVPVDDLRRLNGMEGDALAIGQRLIVEPCDLLAAAAARRRRWRDPLRATSSWPRSPRRPPRPRARPTASSPARPATRWRRLPGGRRASPSG